MDFTKEKIEELETEAFDLYGNFCLLENNIFYSGIRGKYAVFFEKPDCILQVNRYITNIREAIKWSKEQPFANCLKILNFIFDKCEKDIQQYSNEFNATLDYAPTQDEVDKYVANISISDDFNDSMYERLMEDGYDKAIKDYEEKHKKEIEGLTMLRKALYSVEKEIYSQKCKQKFIKEALASQNEEKPPKPDISDFICAPDKKRAESIIKQVLIDKKGKQVAISIIALEKTKYIKIHTRSSFYEVIRLHFGYDIGTDQSINKYLTKSSGKIQEKREYAFFSNTEIEEEIESITQMCQEI